MNLYTATPLYSARKMEIKTSNINKPSSLGILLTSIFESGATFHVDTISERNFLRSLGILPNLPQNHKPKSAKTSKSVPYKKTLCHSLNPATAPVLHKKTLV